MIRYGIITACFIVFDVITGFIKALAQKAVDSTALRKGLFHKLSEIVAINFAFLCEYAVNYLELGIHLPMVIGVCSYLVLMETISILENLIELNPRLGKFFAKYLKKLKEGTEKYGSEADQLPEEGEQHETGDGME